MRIAVLNDDSSALERLLSEQFTVNAPTNRRLSGRSAVLELIRQAPRESFEQTIEYLPVESDFGIIMGRGDGSGHRWRSSGRSDGTAAHHKHLEEGSWDVADGCAARQRDRAELNSVSRGSNNRSALCQPLAWILDGRW
jgi:hypothetical protein